MLRSQKCDDKKDGNNWFKLKGRSWALNRDLKIKTVYFLEAYKVKEIVPNICGELNLVLRYFMLPSGPILSITSWYAKVLHEPLLLELAKNK